MAACKANVYSKCHQESDNYAEAARGRRSAPAQYPGLHRRTELDLASECRLFLSGGIYWLGSAIALLVFSGVNDLLDVGACFIHRAAIPALIDHPA
jgi:hypothetical protein